MSTNERHSNSPRVTAYPTHLGGAPEAYEAGYINGYLTRECEGDGWIIPTRDDAEWLNALPTWVCQVADAAAFVLGCKDGYAAGDEVWQADEAEAGVAPDVTV